MTDLKNIPYELQNLMKVYSSLSNTVHNVNGALDIYKIDLQSLEEGELQSIIYSNLDKVLNAQVKMTHIYGLIEDFIRNNLNINFSNILIWESKIEFI